jgi:hypothetical protein
MAERKHGNPTHLYISSAWKPNPLIYSLCMETQPIYIFPLHGNPTHLYIPSAWKPNPFIYLHYESYVYSYIMQ